VVAETWSRTGAEYYEDSPLLIIDGDVVCFTIDICQPSYYQLIEGRLILLNEL